MGRGGSWWRCRGEAPLVRRCGWPHETVGGEAVLARCHRCDEAGGVVLPASSAQMQRAAGTPAARRSSTVLAGASSVVSNSSRPVSRPNRNEDVRASLRGVVGMSMRESSAMIMRLTAASSSSVVHNPWVGEAAQAPQHGCVRAEVAWCSHGGDGDHRERLGLDAAPGDDGAHAGHGRQGGSCTQGEGHGGEVGRRWRRESAVSQPVP